jgi:RNA polymerase I-specific transcription initiation factor RRN3
VEIEDLSDEQLFKISQNVFANVSDVDDLDNEIYDDEEDKRIKESVLKELLEEGQESKEDEPVLSDSEESDDDAPVVLSITDMILKLDILMLLVFRHLDKQATGNDATALHKSFHWIFNSFKSFVMPTFRSRYTQFIVFYILSLDKAFANTFIQELQSMHVAKPSDRSVVCAFLASFAARASYLGVEQLLCIINGLGSFCDDYLDRVAHLNIAIPNTIEHEHFYAAVQAIFYIFCFRWKELVASEDPDTQDSVDAKAISRFMTWQRFVGSQLNPLKVPLNLSYATHQLTSLRLSLLPSSRSLLV